VRVGAAPSIAIAHMGEVGHHRDGGPGVQKVVGRQCALEDCRTPRSTATSRTFARCLWAQPLSSLWLELQGLTRYRGHFA
jgi:hypothetical protein